MRVREVRPWRRESWTKLYEAALFERNPARLWTRIQSAQLAIFDRQNQIRFSPTPSTSEKVALKRANTVLQDLQRLSKLGDLQQAS
jgi:hypothetical protein